MNSAELRNLMRLRIAQWVMFSQSEGIANVVELMLNNGNDSQLLINIAVGLEDLGDNPREIISKLIQDFDLKPHDMLEPETAGYIICEHAIKEMLDFNDRELIWKRYQLLSDHELANYFELDNEKFRDLKTAIYQLEPHYLYHRDDGTRYALIPRQYPWYVPAFFRRHEKSTKAATNIFREELIKFYAIIPQLIKDPA